MRGVVAGLGVWVFAAACGQSSVGDVEVDGDDTAEESDLDPQADVPVTGLDISRVALYQAVEVVLFDEDGAPDDQVSLIAGRDAMLRIFVDPRSEWEERKVVARVTVGDEVITKTKKIAAESDQAKLNTTINVDIPGDMLEKGVEIGVVLFEEDGLARDGDDGRVSWQSGDLELKRTDALEVVIIPVKYNYDGSGRMPDTSAEQLAAIRDHFVGMYPASDVTVSVGDTLNWNKRISASQGWEDLLWTVNGLRGNANEAPNTYYYAMFRPTDSFNSFCAGGCVLGLSFLGMSADPWFRASIGIGYSNSYSVDTVPHEIGHAHGREHAPCGLYGQPPDPQYPYAEAKLGTWGYDLVSGELIKPSEGRDVMSYCAPMWVSDYTYEGLFARIQEVGRQNRAAAASWRAMRVRADGGIEPGDVVQLADPGGEPRQVTLLDEGGRAIGVETGRFVPYDHLEGGVLLVPDRPLLYTAAW